MSPPVVTHGMCLKIINDRNMKGGMGSETNPLKFMDQDYDFLQDYCLKTRQRFVDEFFPPDPRSIGEGLLDPDVMARVEWKRPTVLYPNVAEFIVETVSRFDYAQGNVGNCWFLASVGALTFQTKLLHKVIPDGQSFNHNYTGLFHFRFWRFGKWYDVVIDDKLPTYNGKLIFVRSKTYNEFWPALLEKAYAKVCGSYADMHTGRVSEALLDFTGGVHMHYELKTAPTDLWEIMLRAYQSEAIMGCETPPGNENRLPNGIVLGHAYTVTKVYQVMSGRDPVQLVRLFIPWGDSEWNGDWSDKSPLWNTVNDEDRKQLLVHENREFWMSMKDFLKTFDNMDICCTSPDFLEEQSACHWTSKHHHGSWVTGSTAGGCMNHPDTFCKNPQFWLRISELDKACEQGQKNVLVSLIQKPDKRHRRHAAHHGIGFCVFAMRSEGKFGSSFFSTRKPVVTSGHFQDARQVMKFFRLEPGEYLIVPSTYYPNKSGEFILSILCKNEIHIHSDTMRKWMKDQKLKLCFDNILIRKSFWLGFLAAKYRKIQVDFKMPPPAVPYGMCLKVVNDRNSKGGMGSETNPLRFMDQDYNFLQDYCLKTRQRFVDEFFPPDPRSIGEGLLDPDVMARVEWKRPMVLYPNAAEFVVETVSRFDYAQGNVGNCWFLASVGALTFQTKLLQKVVPDGQSFSHNYTGLFHFRLFTHCSANVNLQFWRFGKWYDVVIDDKLPTYNGKLIFVRSKTYNEFWPALLEKAYAKVCGSYADMHSGRVSEALLDFTGGVHMHYELKTAPADLWEIMYRAYQSEVLMGCETPPGNENRLPNGIVLGHAYTITKVYQVMSGSNPVHLVRLFNPWGDSEWNGDWSDKSPLWNTVNDEDYKQLLVRENGEFWMSMKDFVRTFDNMDICCICPDFLEEQSACHWTSKYHHGSWVTGSTAGGCMNHPDTFCKNPQFWLRISELDKACEQGQKNVLVSLIQTPDKRHRRRAAHHGIGFYVFAMRSEGKFGSSFFSTRKPVVTSGDFQDARQVMKFFRLEPGEYLIVPSTFHPNKSGEFILCILCKNEIHIQSNTLKMWMKDQKLEHNIFDNILISDPKSEHRGLHLNEDILNLMFVRYAGASEHISLEGFICLVMRLNCMARIFQRLCENGKITLDESEWIGLTMYS
ncbi:calpain-1 catalytic subunit-like protein [Labeo rohita]|uniref:Calpain-1 catalytic subunit-like protein n=1 Tax=Labeo rohita TaxID=84645 RepID=A0A498M1T7_LABRO|nr:calpain-1 catalytic subunit-like protein [Labeo rohita]